MAPRSKRQRHLKKLVDSQERKADGRFREEVVYLRESNAGNNLNLIEAVTGDLNSEVIIDESDFDGFESIQVDDSTWTALPGCEDDFDNEEQNAAELDHDMNDSKIGSSLLASIEETEKRWRETGANFGRRDCGTSRTTFFRRNKKKAADLLEDRALPKINSFFAVQPRDRAYDTDEEIEQCQVILGEVAVSGEVQRHFSIEEALEDLRPLITDSRAVSSVSNKLLPWEITRARAVYRYFLFLFEGVSKMESSGNVAFFFYPHATKKKTLMTMADASKSYKARTIRLWADQYLDTGVFQKYKQGQHVKTFSVINDETNKKIIQGYLRAMTDEERTPSIFREHCNKPDGLLTKFREAPTKICYETAKRWMILLGFKATTASKGWFTDSHERADVVESRVQFLENMAEIESRMRFYSGDDLMIEIPPVLEEGKKEAVLVTHDESTFYCNEGRRYFWLENGKKKLLPKSKGLSIMISGFCCHCHGFVSLPGGSKSYQLFKAGTSREGWFTNQHLVDQFHGCIDALRHYHPDCELTIAFDNSMTHRARAPDGLDAKRLNKVSRCAFVLSITLFSLNHCIYPFF
jgi:hypothetical protein